MGSVALYIFSIFWFYLPIMKYSLKNVFFKPHDLYTIHTFLLLGVEKMIIYKEAYNNNTYNKYNNNTNYLLLYAINVYVNNIQ